MILLSSTSNKHLLMRSRLNLSTLNSLTSFLSQYGILMIMWDYKTCTNWFKRDKTTKTLTTSYKLLVNQVYQYKSQIFLKMLRPNPLRNKNWRVDTSLVISFWIKRLDLVMIKSSRYLLWTSKQLLANAMRNVDQSNPEM